MAAITLLMVTVVFVLALILYGTWLFLPEAK